MYYLGIDLHKNDPRVAVLDDDGAVVQEARVQNANLAKIAEEYAGSKAAIEATSNYYTIYDTLDEYLDVVVADPTQTKAISYAEVKNDRLDAKLLAQLRRAGMIAESYVPPYRERPDDPTPFGAGPPESLRVHPDPLDQSDQPETGPHPTYESNTAWWACLFEPVGYVLGDGSPEKRRIDLESGPGQGPVQ
jgi:hypothetical protein